ncbi:MAG: hypothetical protein [Caudoviricetes sp.]|nr:MAG: hypothetical protein [Caudoviricetes sp.]
MRQKKLIKFEMRGDCMVCVSHAHNKDGYLRLLNRSGSGPRMKMYHRITYEATHGTIPEGYEVDHTCRNRACQNVKHLQLLTVAEHKAKTNKERSDDTRVAALDYKQETGCSVQHLAEKFNVKLSRAKCWERYWAKQPNS